MLAYETSRLQVDDPTALPLVHGTNYSIGPATSPATALGLGRYIATTAESALLRSTETDQETDNQ